MCRSRAGSQLRICQLEGVPHCTARLAIDSATHHATPQHSYTPLPSLQQRPIRAPLHRPTHYHYCLYPSRESLRLPSSLIAMAWQAPAITLAMSASRLAPLVCLLAYLPLCLANVAIPYSFLGPEPVSTGGMYALRASYNQSYVPWNESYPTVNIGLSLSLLGTVREEGWTDFLAMLVDVTNFRGGVRMNGVPHYVRLTYSVDDGSPHLTRLIYSDMFNSGNYSAYIAPQTDTLLQALLPLLPNSNATVVSTYNPDPADFSGYDNLFGLLPPDDLLFSVSLTDINEKAQQSVAAGGEGSVHGLRTICQFAVNESLPQARAEGVRQWVQSENKRRNGTDPVTLLVDTLWARTALDYSNYTAALAACPDNVDVMVLLSSDSDGLDSVLALQASELRPKAVIGLVEDRTIDSDDPTQLATAAGWIIPVGVLLGTASIYDIGGVFTDVYDVAYANTVWRAGAGLADVLQNPYAYVYATSFTVCTAALTVASSVEPEDMRAAMLSLNGQTTVFSGIEFDNNTGFNTRLVPVVLQALPSGTSVAGNSSVLLYPYDWPWRRPANGELLEVHNSVNQVLIAVVISVLGAWVALIIAEQSIFLKRQGSRYWPLWLFLVAVALGGVAIWCTQVMTASALQTLLPGSDEPLNMTYSADAVILALVPGVLLTYVGLLVLMGDVTSGHRSSSTTSSGQPLVTASDARAARSAEYELTTRKAREKHAASLSTLLHLQHLRNSVTWRVLLGGFIVSVAMYETRVVVLYMWVQPAEWSAASYLWVLLWPFDAFFTVLSCLLVFHALRTRYVGAFLFAATVLSDWFIVLEGLTFRYQTTGEPLPAALLTANVSYTTISLVSGIIAACICFIFVGLQFSRMQLSRNGLSLLAASMQANIARLQDKLKLSEDSNGQLKLQLSAICKQVAHTTMNTPISTHYAYCMAQATTLESYQSMWQVLSSSPAVSKPAVASAASGRMTKHTPSVSSESSPTNQSRALPTASNETTVNNRPPLRFPSITMTPTRSASVAPLPPLPMLRLRGSTTVADDTERTPHGGAEPSRSAAAAESSPGITSRAPLTANRRRKLSISGTSVNGGDTTSRSKRAQPSRNNRSYEEQLAALLDQSSPFESEETPQASLSPGGQNKASISMLASANTAGNAGLSTLLQHPACVAVIKGELQAIHSVENLIFYLHAQRYRQLQSAKLRKTVATAMYETFVREGAEQQININARQRDGIGFCVTKRGDDSCANSLFDEAQREVMQLMETNMLGSKAERQCAWLMAQMPLLGLIGSPPSDEDVD